MPPPSSPREPDAGPRPRSPGRPSRPDPARPARPHPPAALVLDFDGTIVNTEPFHEAALRAVARPHGLCLDPGCSLGRSDEHVLLAAFRAARVPHTDDLIAELVRDKARIFLDLATDPDADLALYPGVRDLLESARAVSIPTAVCTASRRAELDTLLPLLAIDHLIDHTVAAEDADRPKPDPAPYRETCRRLAADPPSVIVIEDSPTGVTSATRAGCYVIAVTHTSVNSDLAHASEIIECIASALRPRNRGA